jgi:hypothetical protein
MAKLNWKKSAEPAPILDLIQTARTADTSGAISFMDMHVHEHMTTLETLLNFPTPHDVLPRAHVIWRALVSCKDALTPDCLLAALNIEYAKAASTREIDFDVLTPYVTILLRQQRFALKQGGNKLGPGSLRGTRRALAQFAPVLFHPKTRTVTTQKLCCASGPNQSTRRRRLRSMKLI